MPFKVKDLMIDLTANPAGILCHPTVFCRIGCTQMTCPEGTICHFGCTYLITERCWFYPTIQHCNFANSHIPCVLGSCLEGSVQPTPTVTWTVTPTTPQYGVQQFGSLKEQLKVALEAAEAQEKAIEEGLKPQTTADVEKLEAKLNEALEELRARKAELKKAGK